MASKRYGLKEHRPQGQSGSRGSGGRGGRAARGGSVPTRGGNRDDDCDDFGQGDTEVLIL